MPDSGPQRVSAPSREVGIDPVTLEVIWNRLLAVVTEQQDALMRTAFSTIVRESQDLACGLFDVRGRMIAQSVSGTPGHINAMATSMGHFFAAYPLATLAPGDVLLTNDPWMTAGQINDITITTPIFRGRPDGRAVRQHLSRRGHRRAHHLRRSARGLRRGPASADYEAVRSWTAQ